MAKNVPCTCCGQMMWRTQVMAAEPTCRSCRSTQPRTHGYYAYRRHKCRCQVCRDANTAKMRAYVATVIERDGISPGRKSRPRKSPAIYDCVDCGQRLASVSGGRSEHPLCLACREVAEKAKRSRRRASVTKRRKLLAQVQASQAGVPANPRWPWVQGRCATCGDNFTRRGQPSPYCSSACSRKERQAARRARNVAAFVAPVSRVRIFERDKWKCRLCGKKVKRDAVVPHPRAPVLDHVLPLARGGTHEPANVQLACFMCNAHKRDGLYLDRPEQLALVG